MRTKAVFLAVLVLTSLALGGAPAQPSVPSGDLDREYACSSGSTLLPTSHELPVLGDYETEVVLDVAVLLVGVDPDVADEIMGLVVDLYAPLGIKVRWVNEAVDFEINPPPDESVTGMVLSTSESRAYIEASKQHFGGARPWWADVVYTMVDGELASAVAGQADCVGGIAYPDAAFAVGEVDTQRLARRNAKIAGHEIAHLLAAHHHFANCAEGDKGALVEDLTPCTLMFNDVGLISLGFSTLEAAVVRYYALEYANDTPTSPPPPEGSPDEYWRGEVERSVKLKLRDGKATGRVVEHSAGDVACSRRVPVSLERKGNGRWRTVTQAKTNRNSAFTFRRLRSGSRYRVVAPEHETDYGATCLAATSPARTSR